jgi:hypothetical protein
VYYDSKSLHKEEESLVLKGVVQLQNRSINNLPPEKKRKTTQTTANTQTPKYNPMKSLRNIHKIKSGLLCSISSKQLQRIVF